MKNRINDYFPCAWCPQSRYLNDNSGEFFCFKDPDIVAWKCNNCNNVNLSDLVTRDIKVLLLYSQKYDQLKRDLNITSDILELTENFYHCESLGFYAAAIMVARKLIVHIIIDKKISEWSKKKNFTEYYEDFKNSGYIGKEWFEGLDSIRDYGNKENHEISLGTKEICSEVETVLNHILRSIYTMKITKK